MSEKFSRTELRQMKASRDHNEAQLRDAVAAAKERFDPVNLSMEVTGHAAEKVKAGAGKAGEVAKKHKFALIGGAALAVAALAYRPVKNLVAEKDDPS